MTLKLREKLFPDFQLPPSGGQVEKYPGVIHTDTIIRVSWKDRIRLLLSGRCILKLRTWTEREAGECLTESVFVILPPLHHDNHTAANPIVGPMVLPKA